MGVDNTSKFPKGTIFIEIQGLYDGWSVARLPDGTLVNRWSEAYPQWKKTQEWIDFQSLKDQLNS